MFDILSDSSLIFLAIASLLTGSAVESSSDTETPVAEEILVSIVDGGMARPVSYADIVFGDIQTLRANSS